MFCRFLLADYQRRPGLVRSLCLDLWPGDTPLSSDILLTTLKLCAGIEKLGLHSCDAIVNVVPPLFPIIESFKNLQVLEVNLASRISYELLAKLNLPIKDMYYTMDPDVHWPEDDCLYSLQRMAPSLERLSTRRVSWDAVLPNTPSQFSSLLHLTIHEALFPALGIIARLCPRLLSLNFPLSTIPPLGFEERMEWMEDSREASQRSQKQHRWTHLERFEGGCMELYASAPQFKIDHIATSFYLLENVDETMLLSPLDWMTSFKDALARCHPTTLECDINSRAVLETCSQEVFSDLGLAQIAIKLFIRIIDLDIVDDFMDGMLKSITRTSIRDFDLSVHWPKESDCIVAAPLWGPRTLMEKYRRLVSIEPFKGLPVDFAQPLLKFIPKLAQTMPSLSTVSCRNHYEIRDSDGRPYSIFTSSAYRWAVIRDPNLKDVKIEEVR